MQLIGSAYLSDGFAGFMRIVPVFMLNYVTLQGFIDALDIWD
ncbi:hypothetical protein [Clostridium sp. KNHs205]|jgi:hypothetical protein|nr:hypothetical protein [Clostridium sp. KNHs205]